MTIATRSGTLEARLVEDRNELRAAQELRYRVFFEEQGAYADPTMRRARCDVDRFDEHADHLVVLDLARSTARRPAVVGCYRLLRERVALAAGGFYSQEEFDLGPLLASSLESGRGELLELGRSCVDPAYRNGTVVQLLWRAIAAYLEVHRCALLFGCASLPGSDVAAVAGPIRYLHERHLAPLHLRPVALAARRVAHEPFAAEGFDPVAAFRALPPLLKGYLRLGAMIGEGAVLDPVFDTIDVCIVLPRERIDARYRRHYGAAVEAPVGTAA
jgi:putative hemolysin